MISTRENLPKVHVLVGEIDALQCRMAEIAKKIDVAKINFNMGAADYEKFRRWEEGASARYDSAENALNHESTYGERQAVDLLKKDARDASEGTSRRYQIQEEARRVLDKLLTEQRKLEENISQKKQIKLGAEETTKKLFRSLGLGVSTRAILFPCFQEEKPSPSSTSAKKSREEILQFQKDLTTELAELQKKYNQRYEQIGEKLQLDDAQLRPKFC